MTLRTLTQVLNSPELLRPPVAHQVAVPQWTQWNLPDREAQFDLFLLPGNTPEVTGWACPAPLAMRSPLVTPQSAVGAMLTELTVSVLPPGSVKEPWPHDNKEEL